MTDHSHDDHGHSAGGHSHTDHSPGVGGQGEMSVRVHKHV